MTTRDQLRAVLDSLESLYAQDDRETGGRGGGEEDDTSLAGQHRPVLSLKQLVQVHSTFLATTLSSPLNAMAVNMDPRTETDTKAVITTEDASPIISTLVDRGIPKGQQEWIAALINAVDSNSPNTRTEMEDAVHVLLQLSSSFASSSLKGNDELVIPTDKKNRVENDYERPEPHRDIETSNNVLLDDGNCNNSTRRGTMKRKRKCEILLVVQYLLYRIATATETTSSSSTTKSDAADRRDSPLDRILQGLCLVLFPLVELATIVKTSTTTVAGEEGEKEAAFEKENHVTHEYCELLFLLLDDEGTTTDEAANVMIGNPSNALLDVLIDATFEQYASKLRRKQPPTTSGESETTASWLSIVLDWIRQDDSFLWSSSLSLTSSRGSAHHLLSWNIRSKCLLRLHDLFLQDDRTTHRKKAIQDAVSILAQRSLLQMVPLISHNSITTSGHTITADGKVDDDDDLLERQALRLRPSDLIHPILQHMLPLLLPSYAAEWWEFVWTKLILESPLAEDDGGCDAFSSSSAVLLGLRAYSAKTILGTAILCAMLPQVRGMDLPIPLLWAQKREDAEQATMRPVQQGQLWQLIQECLQQGIRLTKKRSWLKDSYQKRSDANTRNGGAGRKVERGGVGHDTSWDELLRRRGIYMLRVLVDPETKDDKTTATTAVSGLADWNRYVACFETMEMENEPHLIDQVWDTVQDLASKCHTTSSSSLSEATNAGAPPSLSWDWMHLLWARVLLSPDAPALRKASICKFCQGQAGVVWLWGGTTIGLSGTEGALGDNKKGKRKGKQVAARGMPLEMVTNEFMVHVILPSFDSLEQSVGTHMHYMEAGKTIKVLMADLVSSFFQAFFDDMATKHDNDKLANFLEILLETRALMAIRNKTVVFAMELIANHLCQCKIPVVITKKRFLGDAAEGLSHLFSLGYILPSYRERMLHALATILSCSELESKNTDAHDIINLLKLYPLPFCLHAADSESWTIAEDPPFDLLQIWLQRIQTMAPKSSWSSSMASTMASAFVDGYLSTKQRHSRPIENMSRQNGSCTEMEVDIGRSIVLMCALLPGSSSDLLWPAINKGLSISPSVALNHWHQADKVSRALVLLEFGGKLKFLSGNGNGDLIVDRKTQQMMPPPPSIEQLLSHSINFLLLRIRGLVRPSNEDSATRNKWNSSRSSDAKQATATFLGIIGLLETLKESYPSSFAISNILDDLVVDPPKDAAEESKTAVEWMLLLFASISGGARTTEKLLALRDNILSLEYKTASGESDQQPLRSLFQCSKWGSLNLLSAQLAESKERNNKAATFFRRLFHVAADSVEACPSEGLLFLFNCIITATKAGVMDEASKGNKTSGIEMETIIEKLFVAFDAADNAADSMCMLDEICSLLFTNELLMNEYRYHHLSDDPVGSAAPIRSAFRRLRCMAGTNRPHILQIALSWICTGWLGVEGQFGLPSLVYKEDILQLISYKEDPIEASSISGMQPQSNLLPKGTHAQSISRAFVLCFLEQLQEHGSNLLDVVKTELLHFLILRLMKDSKAKDSRTMAMLGSPEYCHKIRCWQGLCILSQFVTEEIADEVCTEAFETLQESLHGQVRYFVEVFCIQCSRKHPALFGRKISEQIRRRDLNLQQIASIMVVTGNLLVGKYKEDFLVNQDGADIHALLAGASPWLSSTQGFSRAIAQLLVHKLIPMAIDTNVEDDSVCDSDWHLRSLFRFLDENPEMRRLRSKQQKYFEKYDVDRACTPEFLFTIPGR